MLILNHLPQTNLKLLLKERVKKQLTGNLIGNKIADEVTRVYKASPQNNSETNREEIFTERYISPVKR